MHSNEKEKDLNRLNKCILTGRKNNPGYKAGLLYMWNGLQTPIN